MLYLRLLDCLLLPLVAALDDRPVLRLVAGSGVASDLLVPLRRDGLPKVVH